MAGKRWRMIWLATFTQGHNGRCIQKREHEMEQVLSATYALGGLGMFFLGVGVIWFVSMYSDKHKSKKP